MFGILIIWLTLALFSFGILGLNYVDTREAVKKPWKVRKDENYTPRISLVVPTYNECEVIDYKLQNLAKLEYPENLMQIVFIDSQSTDSTVDIIRQFDRKHPKMNIQIVLDDGRKGKSSALNTALEICTGNVVVVSDADCFYPPDILSKSMSYMADPTVGAISGPKKLLNVEDSSVTRSEDKYLKSMNLMKLGESKKSSTIFFEGGFGAYKKDVLDCFDPYNTGSDDCGTVIGVLQKSYRAIMLPEAEFFTTFPRTWKGKVDIKIRRANQLIQILLRYANLLTKNEIRTARTIVAKNLLIYLLSPIIFPFFVASTLFLMLKFPLTILLLLLFLVPKVRGYLVEILLSYLILLYSIILITSNKKFTVWKKPQDRALLTEDMLIRNRLI